jgi:hypothetical protein
MKPKATPPSRAIYRGLAVWIGVTFGVTALVAAYLQVINVNPVTDFAPVIILAAYTPSLAAVVAATLAPGTGGLGALLKQLTVWRIRPAWYAGMLLGPFALVLVALFLYSLLGGAAEGVILPTGAVIGHMMGPLIAGSLGEELGWRGYAQRLLQMRFSLLGASMIVGILWATWHLWPVLAPGGSAQLDALNVAEAYARLIATAVIYGWAYARTGSLLLVMLAHAGHNIAIDLLSPTALATTTLPMLVAGLYVAAAAALVVVRRKDFFGRPNSLA